MTDSSFDLGVFALLYDGQTAWPTLAEALAAAQMGDGRPLLDSADRYNDRSPDGTHSPLIDACSAIQCLDGPAIAKQSDRIAAFWKVQARVGQSRSAGRSEQRRYLHPMRDDARAGAPGTITSRQRRATDPRGQHNGRSGHTARRRSMPSPANFPLPCSSPSPARVMASSRVSARASWTSLSDTSLSSRLPRSTPPVPEPRHLPALETPRTGRSWIAALVSPSASSGRSPCAPECRAGFAGTVGSGGSWPTTRSSRIAMLWMARLRRQCRQVCNVSRSPGTGCGRCGCSVIRRVFPRILAFGHRSRERSTNLRGLYCSPHQMRRCHRG